MSEMNVNQLLAQMRTLAAQAQLQPPPAQASGPDQTQGHFAELLKSSIDQVSDAQQNAARVADAFELGDQQVNLADVMVALQKANLSFQAMTQVRNKLVSAYQEIMNMNI